MKNVRLAALLLAVALLLPGLPAYAAADDVEHVSSIEELAWKIANGVNSGVLSFAFQGCGPFDDMTPLLNLCGSGTWLNIKSIRWSIPQRTGGAYTLEVMLYESTEVRRQCEDQADKIVAACIEPGMSVRAKYKALHDWVVNHCTYGINTYYDGQSAWNALLGGMAVCNGYSKAFMLLCERAGLPCLVIFGSSNSSTSGTYSHAWNMVACEGQWLYIDTTWDEVAADGKAGVHHTYFLLERQTFEQDHTPSADYSKMFVIFNPNRVDMADTLRDYGLFAGTGKGYELFAVPDRNQCAVMYLKFLGLGGAYARNPDAYSHPFTDVAPWADEYVAVMYTKGYTAGISPTLYGGYQHLTLQQYSTFMLRALGYRTDTDFTYANAVSFAISRGIFSRTESEAIAVRGFRRGDMVLLSYRALASRMKDGSGTLLDYLSRVGAV